jgi:hypothetical protein
VSGPLDEDAVAVEEHRALLGSGPMSVAIPRIDTADDLTLGIRYADRHPYARWYVIKRAAVLGAVDRLPHWPERTEVPVTVERTGWILAEETP